MFTETTAHVEVSGVIPATPFSTRGQLRQPISGMQQQGLVTSRWCKNLATIYASKKKQETTSENT